MTMLLLLLVLQNYCVPVSMKPSMTQFCRYSICILLYFTLYSVCFSECLAVDNLLSSASDTTQPMVNFGQASFRFYEHAGTIRVPVILSHKSDSLIKVSIVSVSGIGNAQPNVDFKTVTEELIFLPGDSLLYVDCTLLEDSHIEDEEYFMLRISDIDNGIIGDLDFALISIVDNEKPFVKFPAFDTLVPEQEAIINIPVLLEKTLSEAASITVSTTPINARPGKEFIPFQSSVTIPAGTNSFWIPVQLLDDTYLEDTSAFTISILSSSNNIGIGIPNAMNIIIIDNDFKPNIQFKTNCNPLNPLCNADTVVFEAFGATDNTILFEVNLSYPALEPIHAHIFTTDSSAYANKHYKPVDEFITILPGVQQYKIGIPIINNLQIDATSIFFLNIGDVSSNCQKGYYTSYRISIKDNDPASIVNGSLQTQDMGIFPNPVNDICHLRFLNSKFLNLSDISLKIINSAGQAFFLPYTLNENGIEIDTKSLFPGIYFVAIADGTYLKMVKHAN